MVKQTTMKHDTVIIQHNKMGQLLTQTFENPGQFKLFLISIQSSLEMKHDFTHFNGTDFIIHIPQKLLTKCVVYTKCVNVDKTNPLSKAFKSRMEAEVIKES